MNFSNPSGCFEVSLDCYHNYTKGLYCAINTNIYTYLREMILTIRLEPGEKLAESVIAEKLNVSRSPVKQALQQLVDDGLAIHQSSKTIVVAPIGYNDCLDLMNARKGIECQGAYESAKYITDEELRTLKSLLLQLKTPDNYSMEEYARIHASFHMTIMKSCRNRYLLDAYTRIHSFLFRYHLYIFKRMSLDDFHEYEHHLPIYHAMKCHCPSQARDESQAEIEEMLLSVPFLSFPPKNQ